MAEKHLNSTNQNTQRLQDSLGFLVNGLARVMRNALETNLHETGLSPTAWTVLMALGEEDNLNQTDLSKRTFLDGATMTRVLDVLESQKFIERSRGRIDRRVQFVTLTRTGKKAYNDFTAYGHSVNDVATKVLTVKQRQQLEESIRKVIDHMLVLQNGDNRGGK